MKKNKRSHELEFLDLGPSYYTQEEYEGCLHQLARIGRFLGGDKATLQAFEKLPKPLKILDVGCGGGQFTLQLARQFPKAQVVGIDISPQAIDFAQRQLQKTDLKNVIFELSPSTHLPFAPKSFDVVTSTLVCHHLNDEALIDFLKNCCRIAKKSVIINDVHRHVLAYGGFACLAGTFFRNRLIFHDGLLSIKRGFKRGEWMDYLHAADLSLAQCSITWHWAFRWVVCIHPP